jgi:hypothetical protein
MCGSKHVEGRREKNREHQSPQLSKRNSKDAKAARGSRKVIRLLSLSQAWLQNFRGQTLGSIFCCNFMTNCLASQIRCPMNK